MFQGLPRWLVAFGVVTIVVIEIAARLPDIMLLPQRLAGMAGEMDAKALQGKLAEITIQKTAAETRATDAQAQLTTAQQAKVEAETKVAVLNQRVTDLQAGLVSAQAAQAQSQARLADAQAGKTAAETRVVMLQQYLTKAQTTQMEALARQNDAQAAAAQAQATQTNMQNAGTALTVGALIVGGLYAADKMGLLPPHQETTTPTGQTYSAPTAQTRRATIKANAANIRSCGGTRCDLVNPGDAIPKGAQVTITGDAVLDDQQYQWFPVSATTGSQTYNGYIAASVLEAQ